MQFTKSAPAKRTGSKKPKRSLLSKYSALGSKGKFLVFIVAFMVIGGSYMAYRSFAATVLNGADGEFTSLAPARILDTRDGTGGVSTRIAQTPVPVQITGRGGVPATGVRAVVMNVTVTGPSAASNLVLWASGTSKPDTSNLNYSAGQTIANQVTVPVGADGMVNVSNQSGNVQVIFDVAGYYTSDTGTRGSRLNAINPTRVLDTRTPTGGHNSPVGQSPVDVQVAGVNGLPSSGISAVVATVTTTQGTAASNLTVWPSGTAKPLVSNLNSLAGQTIANTITVKLGADGKLQMANSSGASNVILDITGYYMDPQPGFELTQQGRFVPLNPARILDTRYGTGGFSKPLGAGQFYSIQVTGAGNVPSTQVDSVVMNVTAVGPTATSHLTLWPSKTGMPLASNLNFDAGQTIPNQVIVKVGPDGKVNVFNNSGSTNLIFDVAGYYVKEDDSVFGSQTSYIFLNNNSAKKVEFDLRQPTIPTTASSTFFAGGGLVSNGNSVSSIGGLYRVTNEGPIGSVRDYFQYSCFPGQQCEVLVPNTPSVPISGGGTRYGIPYSISAGTTYHITQELLTNTPGHGGIWEQISIANNGVTTPLMRQYIGPASTAYQFYVIDFGQSTSINTCKSPQTFSMAVTNIKTDGAIIPYAQNPNQNLVSNGSNSSATCPGYSNLDFNKAVDGSMVVNQTLGVTSGRDAIAPKITSMSINGSTVNVTATDNKAIATYYISEDNIGFTQLGDVSTLGSNGLANSITRTSATLPYQTPGSHTVTVIVEDTSHNTTTKSVVINL